MLTRRRRCKKPKDGEDGTGKRQRSRERRSSTRSGEVYEVEACGPLPLFGLMRGTGKNVVVALEWRSLERGKDDAKRQLNIKSLAMACV